MTGFHGGGRVWMQVGHCTGRDEGSNVGFVFSSCCWNNKLRMARTCPIAHLPWLSPLMHSYETSSTNWRLILPNQCQEPMKRMPALWYGQHFRQWGILGKNGLGQQHLHRRKVSMKHQRAEMSQWDPGVPWRQCQRWIFHSLMSPLLYFLIYFYSESFIDAVDSPVLSTCPPQ